MTTTPTRDGVRVAPPLLAGVVVTALSVAFAVLLAGPDLLAAAGLLPDGGDPDGLGTGLGDVWSGSTFFVGIGVYGATCYWLERSRDFAKVHAPEFPHARGTAGTWLGWLVPVLDWWFPYQAVRDLRRATSRGARPGWILGLWWLPWLVFTIAQDHRWLADDPTADLSTEDLLVRSLALCAALLPWLTIVRQVGADQRELERASRLP